GAAATVRGTSRRATRCTNSHRTGWAGPAAWPGSTCGRRSTGCGWAATGPRLDAMGGEIERKYLVAAGGAPGEGRPTPLRQGYLSDGGARTEVRVRASGDRTLLTVKRSRAAEGTNVRDEIEFPVTAEVFDELWALTEGDRIVKDRY